MVSVPEEELIESVPVASPEGCDRPRQYGTLGPIVLYDRREGLSGQERSETLHVINEVFGMIADEGSTIPDTAIEVDGRKVDEIYVAREIERSKKGTTKEIAHGASFDGNAKARLQALEISRRNVLMHGGAKARLQALETLRRNVLMRGLASRLEGTNGERLKTVIADRIIAIQSARKSIGRPLYPRDAVLMLVYEFVYENYLWRGRQRRDGSSYYESHLLGAVDELIAHNLVSLSRILSALKHDTYEDLRLHRENFSENDDVTPRGDFLLCDELYSGKFTGEQAANKFQTVRNEVAYSVHALTKRERAIRLSSEDEEAFCQRRDQMEVVAVYERVVDAPYSGAVKVCEQVSNARTLSGLGEKRAGQKLSTAILPHWTALARVLQLEEAYRKLAGAGIDYYEEHNRCDLRGRYNDLQRENILRFLRNEQLLGKLLKRQLNLAMLASYACSETWDATELPGVTGLDLSDHIGALLKSFDANTMEADATRLQTRERICDLFEPVSDDIECVSIVPTTLEDFVDLSRLDDKDYCLYLPEEHPLFEIVILARDGVDLFALRSSIEKLSGFKIFKGPFSVMPEGMPNRGIMLYLTDEFTGLTISVRINTSKQEANAKRGILQDPKRPLPFNVAKRIKSALSGARLRGPVPTTPADTLRHIETEVLPKSIVVITDPSPTPGKPTQHATIALADGANVLDFMAALPPRVAMQAFSASSVSASIMREQPDSSSHVRLSVDLFDPLGDGDRCRLHFDDETSGVPRMKFDLGWVSFTTDPRFGDLVAEYFRKTPVSESIDRARSHIQHLAEILGLEDEIPLLLNLIAYAASVFGVNDCNILGKLGELRSFSAPELELSPRVSGLADGIASDFQRGLDDVLMRVGTGRFDVLKVLAFYVDRTQSPTIHMTVTDREGVLGEIGSLAEFFGLNIQHIDSTEGTGTSYLTIRFNPLRDHVGNADILKFILRLGYCDFTHEIHMSPELFNFNAGSTVGSPAEPPQQVFCAFAEACTDTSKRMEMAKFLSPTRRARYSRPQK